MARRGRPRRDDGAEHPRGRGGRARKRDVEEAQPFQGATMDLRKVLTAEKEVLAHLNDRITNLNDQDWVRGQIDKTTAKRDLQEVRVLTVEDACRKLGLTVVEEPLFPGTPPDPREPRSHVRDAVERPTLPGVVTAGALPPPSAPDCEHIWEQVDDDWRRCTACGLMDGVPCRVVTEADSEGATVICPACGGLLEEWEGTTHEDHPGIYHLGCAPWLQEKHVVDLLDVTPESLVQEPPAKRRPGRPRKQAAASAVA